MLLVRDVMTIGVPVCRETETCATVAARLTGEVVVVLDADGMACGWTTFDILSRAAYGETVGEVMEDGIPTVPPDIPIETAAQLMRDRGVQHLFLMHAWPGEPRPSAVISLKAVEERLAGEHL
jgi:CBS domain-containing protein